jgi:hypothetical protein
MDKAREERGERQKYEINYFTFNVNVFSTRNCNYGEAHKSER